MKKSIAILKIRNMGNSNLKIAVDTEALAKNISDLGKDIQALPIEQLDKPALTIQIQQMIEQLETLKRNIK
ncbi:MAG: hypothetical protein KDD27_08195 [Saprospiraceae bacterium]|nr:hypothetical protein [Saprospiraceae bacterium]